MFVAAERKDFERWVSADEQLRLHDDMSQMREILGDFKATVDFPASVFYKELLRDNPGAKVWIDWTKLDVVSCFVCVEVGHVWQFGCLRFLSRFERPLCWLMFIELEHKNKSFINHDIAEVEHHMNMTTIGDKRKAVQIISRFLHMEIW